MKSARFLTTILCLVVVGPEEARMRRLKGAHNESDE